MHPTFKPLLINGKTNKTITTHRCKFPKKHTLSLNSFGRGDIYVFLPFPLPYLSRKTTTTIPFSSLLFVLTPRPQVLVET
ncbi:hypothetical protein EPI10_032936 [Gossypium australe]|uniref:Uncharacterized protein n=1 Tax=Gossypium australe TaxID=47621 RepID=A0A5B6X610_9ROSI|nr:hypothetical protein EPI10_032936 [Gossypium australe]